MTTRRKAIELFLSSTVAVVAINGVITSCASTSEDETASKPESSPTTAPIADAGEGGEGISTDNPDVNYLATLGLMKGHLIVAEELLTEKKYAEAEPHIAHPVEELYGDLETELPKRNVPDFKITLNKLQDLAKTAPDSPEMMQAYKESMAAIDNAIAAMPKEKLTSPEVVNVAMVQILKTAAAEYEAAIVSGEIVEPIEYQDSRGFIIYSEQLYKTVADVMKQSKPENHQIIMENLTALKAILPSVNPPATAVKEPHVVNDLVSEIELYS